MKRTYLKVCDRCNLIGECDNELTCKTKKLSENLYGMTEDQMEGKVDEGTEPGAVGYWCSAIMYCAHNFISWGLVFPVRYTFKASYDIASKMSSAIIDNTLRSKLYQTTPIEGDEDVVNEDGEKFIH